MNLDEIKTEVYCRTCLTTACELWSMLENQTIAILKNCTSVEVQFNDQYSNMICNLCLASLYQFQAFKSKCIEVDQLLNNYGDTELKLNKHVSTVDSSVSELMSAYVHTETHTDDETNSLNESASDDATKPIVKLEACDKSDTYACSSCDKTFKLKRNLIQHVAIKHKHANNVKTSIKNEHLDDNSSGYDGLSDVKTRNIVECSKCGKTFAKKNSLRKHMLRKHKKFKSSKRDGTRTIRNVSVVESSDEKKVKHYCKSCDKTFTKRIYLVRHQSKHKKFVCPVVDDEDKADKCAEQFKRLSALLFHIKTVHEHYKPQLQCESCDVRFYIDTELQQHIKREHTGGMCLECGVRVTQWGKHRRQVHADFKLFNCDICDRKFKIKRNLELHKITHANGEGDARVVCNYCGIKMLDVESHILKKHTPIDGQPKPKMTCRYCRAQFDGLSSLIMHSKTEHTKERALRADNYSCKMCDKKYMNIQGLRLHIRYVHNKFEPIICKICGHKSKKVTYYKLHMRVHTDERPYACDLCPRKFKSNSTLTDHRRTHTGEKPHVCNFCNKGFTQRSALTTHLRMHSKTQDC